MENSSIIAEWLKDTLCKLVDDIESVNVDIKKDDMGILFTVDVANNEWGKVIGKGGETAKAIRTMVRSLGFKSEMRCTVKFNAPMNAPART